MTQKTPVAPNYAVHITEGVDGVELRIKELLIIVRGASVEGAYQKLLEHRSEILDWATTLGLLDQLPVPCSPPALRASLLSAATLTSADPDEC
jgi:hypothetical protein